MTELTRFKLFFWYFSRFQVPLIGHLKPKLLAINDQQVVVKIPLKRRSKNHLHSMYFGALAVGADVAGGLHGFYHARKQQVKVSLAFKSFNAQFLRRPEQDVYFVFNGGDEVKAMIMESRQSKQRINRILPIQAFTDYPVQSEAVAQFQLELSLKVID